MCGLKRKEHPKAPHCKKVLSNCCVSHPIDNNYVTLIRANKCTGCAVFLLTVVSVSTLAVSLFLF